MLDNRKLQILREIMSAHNGIPIKNLEEKVKVSRRTIYYDLKAINYWLETNDLAPISSSRQYGFFMNREERKAIEALLPVIKEYEYEPSAEERIALILLLITCSDTKCGVQELSELTYVSRSTCLKDMKSTAELLATFEVGLEYDRTTGYYLEGQEVSIRKAIAYAITMLLDHFYTELLDERLKKALDNEPLHLNLEEAVAFFKKELIRVETLLERKFNDRMFRFISYYFALVLFRIGRGLYTAYPAEEVQEIKATKGYVAAQFLASRMDETFSMTLSEDEISHITIQLLCASLDAYYVNQPSDLLNRIKSEIIPMLVHDFETLACVRFEEQEKLQENLYLHFIPAYYRTVYQIPIENPIKEEIMSEFADLYELTKKSLVNTERSLDLRFNASEISYFTMHFGSWFKKQGINLHTKNIAIVCPSGIATSNFIAKQIVNLLPDECNVRTYSFREFSEMEPKVDLIVTTSHMKHHDGVIHVTPIITRDDKKEILDRLGYKRKAFYKSEIVHDMLNIIEKHCHVDEMHGLVEALKDYFSDDLTLHEEVKYKPMLSELILQEHVQVLDSISDWKKAIECASQPLLDKGYIQPSYVESMIETVISVGPYFVVAPMIAIPHARPESGVHKLSMSLLKLDQPVAFDERPENEVKLLIILAAEDNSSHLKALAQLTELLSKEDEVNTILDADSIESIMSVIDRY